jgi:hypothetical protein
LLSVSPARSLRWSCPASGAGTWSPGCRRMSSP